jgi:hypothetical protein
MYTHVAPYGEPSDSEAGLDIYDHKLVASDSQADMVKVVDDLIDLDNGYYSRGGTTLWAAIESQEVSRKDLLPGTAVAWVVFLRDGRPSGNRRAAGSA